MKYLILAIILSGCESDGSTNISIDQKINDLTELIVVNVKGKDLGCIRFRNNQGSSFSCNWDKYNKENNQ